MSRGIALTRAAGVLAAIALMMPSLATASPVPQGFVGAVVDGPLYPQPAGGVNLNAQFAAMVASGVENIKVVFDWSYAQPYAGFSGFSPRSAHSSRTSVASRPGSPSSTGSSGRPPPTG